MKKRRENRLNSLLKEIISETIKKELVHNKNIDPLLSVTKVEISKDLRNAKVYISVIGKEEKKESTINALNKAAGFISSISSKKVSIRYFPTLKFFLDTSVEKFMKIENILEKIKKEDG